ncbi:MAG: glycosyltransferase family 39 protein [Acidobacteria bacterium]|nr:glycosyltransferase family 39 protein [Acidobacteriota bacterium]
MTRPLASSLLVAAAPVALLAAFVLASVALGEATGFFPVLSDFWGNAFAATHWKWSARQQWNGFYPPGYPTILAALPGRRLVESAYYFNLVAGVGLLLSVWAFTARWAGAAAALVAMVAVAAHPLVLTQVLTTGPDALFLTLAVAGALVAFTAISRRLPSARLLVAAGLLLGTASWVRYHGLSWALAVLAAALVVGGGRRVLRPVAMGAAVFVSFAAGLALLGIAAGDLGALARDQAFNVYKGHVGAVDWFHLDRASLPATIGEAIARDPSAFWQSYLSFGLPHLWLGLACVLAAAVASGAARRFALFVLGIGLAFVPLVNLGASPRGIASLVPLVLVAVTWGVADALTRIDRRWMRTAAAGVALLSAAAYVWHSWLPEHRRYLEEVRYRSARAVEIEALLRADRVQLGTQVFAVADFHFVNAPGWHVGNYFPRIAGGWPTLDLPEFLDTYPPPSTANLDAFLDDCRRFGISHLVLSDASGALFPALGQLFDGRVTSARVADIGGIPGVRIFRIVG